MRRWICSSSDSIAIARSAEALITEVFRAICHGMMGKFKHKPILFLNYPRQSCVSMLRNIEYIIERKSSNGNLQRSKVLDQQSIPLCTVPSSIADFGWPSSSTIIQHVSSVFIWRQQVKPQLLRVCLCAHAHVCSGFCPEGMGSSWETLRCEVKPT